MVKHTGGEVNWHSERDVSYTKMMAKASTKCEPEEMSAEDPIIYFIYFWFYWKTKRRSYIQLVATWFMLL